MDTITPQSSMTEAQRNAIAAAQNGDWGPADELELKFLSGNAEIKARIATQRWAGWHHWLPTDKNNGSHLRAIELEHDNSPASVTAVIWVDGRCRSCVDGFHDNHCLRTDIDGNVIKEPEADD